VATALLKGPGCDRTRDARVSQGRRDGTIAESPAL
jgi:hypothetical protein